MGFDDYAETAIGAMFSTSNMGTAATYTPSGGVAVSCTVHKTTETELEQDGYEGETWTQHTTIEALLSETGQEPGRGDTFLISGTTYTVQDVTKTDDYTSTMIVKA